MIPRLYLTLLLTIFFLSSGNLQSATILTQTNGNWNVTSTWSCNCLPTTADDVILNHTVTIQNGSPVTISSITINSGSTLDVQDGLTFSGTLTVSGNITFNALSATMNFNEIIINSSGNWTVTSTINPMISGNFTNNGSFTAGSGTYTFTSSNGSAVIGGNNSISIYVLSFNSGAQYTNNGTIYVNNLNGAGTLTQGSNSYLRISGIASLMTLNAGTNPNVVEYNGSSQTIRTASYWDLLLSGSAATLGGATTIVGDLKIHNGTLNTGTFQITTNPGDSMLMKANTVFNVGSTGSAQTVDFPFFNAYQLDNSSTVSYQGNYNQQVLASYGNLAYGNLTLTTGAASVVKTLTGILPSPFTLIVNGNLNLPSSKLNFNIGDDLVNVGGDLQGIGMIQITSGRINVKGNFSNTGGFTAGMGTINYNGSANQYVRTVSYWNLIISGSSIKTLLGATTVNGNLTISGSAQLDVGASNFSLTLNGSNMITNTTAADPFIERNGMVSFQDNDGLPDTIGGNDTITFFDLKINQVSKSAIFLTAPIFVSDSIILTSGVIFSSTGNETVIAPMAFSFPGNDSSFVDGPVVKLGAGNFTFPVGNSSKWAPVGISSMSGDDNTRFTAQYFNTWFGTYSVSFMDHVSELEYWKLDRSGTLTPANVTLYWKNQTESQINDYSNLTVARYNGINWVDEGRSAMDSANPGSVTSFAVSNFSPFTFGSYAGGGSNSFILANTITVDSLSDSAFCPGENVLIYFSASGTFSNGNMFYAELSDATGNFAAPDTIGTLAAMVPGVIIGTIPVVPTGNGYRVRVVSTLPPVTGSDNGFDLFIDGTDSDGDGIFNSCDNCLNGYNPGQGDMDLDGVGDSCDNCIMNYNPLQEDINGNSIGDACDQISFQKIFGGLNNDYGNCILQTPDGGYVMAGNSQSFGSGGNDIYLLKTDATGNLLWSQTYGGSSADNNYSIRQTADSGFIIAGSTQSFGAAVMDIFLIKTDFDGTLLWSKTFGGNNFDYARSVVQASDGGYVVAGTTASFGAGSWDFYLVKTFSDGTLDWYKTIGGLNLDEARSIIATSDGGFMIAGNTSSFGAGNADLYLIKTDATGTVQWTKTFGGTVEDYGTSIQQTNDNGYVITGYSNSFGSGNYDVYLVKTDAAGNLLWARTFGGINDDRGSSVHQSSDGGFIIAGYTNSFGAGNYDSYLIKTDGNGQFQWSKTFGGTLDDKTDGLTLSNDGGFALSGYTSSFTAGIYKVYQIKTDAAGNAGGCNDMFAFSSPVVLSVSESSGGTSGSGGTAGTPSAIVTNPSTIDTSICISVVCNLSVSLTVGNVTCFGKNDGTIQVVVTGGSAPYTYLWSNGDSIQNIDSLTADTYIVKITDYYGCTLDTSVSVNEPLPLFLDMDSLFNVSCAGGTDGAVFTTASGGTPPYTYMWNPSGGGNGDTLNVDTGTYYITVADANGCSVVLSDIVTEPPALTITINSVNTASCSIGVDGAIYTTPSGGTPPYVYSWNPSGGTDDDTVNILPGIYSLTVTDSKGCTFTSTATVPFNPEPTANAGPDKTICYGNSHTLSGSIGGSATASTWSTTGSGTFDNPSSLTATYTPSSGDFSMGSIQLILITNDADGGGACQPGRDTMVLTIAPLPSLSTSATFDYDTCNGTVTANVTGGTSPYNYLWDDPLVSTTDTVTGLCGGVYHVTVTDNSSCTATDSANVITAMVSFTADTNGGCAPVTANFTNTSNLGVSGVAYLWYFGSDGPYFIYDTSYTFTAGGMQTIWLFAIDTDINILGSDSMNINFSGSSGFFVMTADSVCPGDNIIFVDDVNISPYYDWNFGDGFYQNGTSNLATHSWFSPGNYSVSLAINTVCGADTIIQPVVVSNSSTGIGTIQTAPQPVCPGDNLQIASFGSSGNFEWNFGDSTIDYSGVPYTVHGYANPGTYIINMTVTDGCGSVITGSDTITVSGGVPISGNFEISANPNPVCPGDMVKLKFEEGENFGSYFWDYGDGITQAGAATMYHSYSLSGNYAVSVTVTNGCGSSTVVTVPVAVQNGVTAFAGEYSYGVIPSSACPGDSVVFYVDGITGGGFVWDFGDGVTDSNYTPMDSSAIIWHAYTDTGIYQAVITITNGCGSSASGTMTVWVSDSFPVVPSWWGEGFTWEGRSNGPSQACANIDFFAFGGSVFKWDFGDGDSVQTTSTEVNHIYTAAGTYTVSLDVTNSCGNSRQYFSIITVTGSCIPLAVTDTSSPPLCNGGNDGWILATVTGGIQPYTFQWSNGESSVDSVQSLIDTLAAGTYILTLTDAAGAVFNDTVILTQPPVFTFATSSNDVTCTDTCDGNISVTAAGGTPPYTYLWSNGAGSPSLPALCTGTYTVTVYDSIACSQTQNFTVAGVPGFFADLSGNPDTNWISPATSRDGLCCTAASPDLCVHFMIITDSLTDRIYLNINSGTVPSGSNYYLNNCDPASTTPLGDTLCLTAGGLHNFTYCKPGNNINDYIIGTRQRPVVNAGNDIPVCPGVDSIQLNSTGSSASSYLWLSSGTGSFFPGSSAISPVYLPSFADISTGSVQLILWGVGACTNVKDTMLILFTPPIALSVVSTPECEPNTGTASVSPTGGTPPYTYLWSNGDTIPATAALDSGSYTVTVTDAAGCNNSVAATIGTGVAFTAAITALINPTCNGGSDGTATAIGSNAPSQSFSVAPNAAIPDAGCSSFNGVNSMINVSGYSAAVNSSGIKVTLNINHTFDADLQIFLTAPNGNTLMLSTGNGGSGDNFINTVFTDGAPGNITMGTAPFTGIFRPEGGLTTSCGVTPAVSTFGAIGGGSINPNGNWSLRAYDNLSADTGRVVNWTLTMPPVPVSGIAFSYQWNDLASQTDSMAIGLTAGTYDVIITDTAGCDDTISVTLIAPLANTGSQTLMICSGDSIQLPDLSWVSADGVYTDTVTGATGCDSIVTTTLTVLPYASFNNSISYEHFESGNGGWVAGGTNSSWQLGAPSATFINGAASGVNGWVTNLTGNYNMDEYSYLSSPCFDMSAFGTDPTLRFSHIYTVEKNFDAHWVELSNDGGNSWTKLGAQGTGINWYNNSVTNTWDSASGSPGQWKIAEHTLAGSAGQNSVIIRFFLSSDYIIAQEGAGVDDVYIGPPPADDAGVIKILQPATGCNDSSENIMVIIKNFGYANLSNVPVSYSVNGGPAVNATAAGPILPGDSLIYLFTVPENLSQPGTYSINAWTSLAADSFPLNNAVTDYTVQTSPICCIPLISSGCGLDYINGVSFSGISNSSTGCNGNPDGYIYYPTDTAVVTKGNSYIIQITPSTAWPEGVGVWIDFNGNGSFGDAGEFVFSAAPGSVPVSGNISIPLTAQLGLTFMRVNVQYNVTPSPTDYCDTLFFGETEDYPVMILPVSVVADVGVIEIFNPGTSCSLSPAEIVSVKIKNFGTDSVNLIPVRYRVNNGIPVGEVANATIGPGDTLLYDFSGTFDFSADGIYTIDAWTAKISDTIGSNDSVINVTVENLTDMSVTALVKNATCGDLKNGAIFLNFISGTPPYSGAWNSAAGSGSDTLYSSDTLVKNVAPGQYNILITDSNGCTDSVTAVITSPPVIASSIVSVTNASCGGKNDGAIDISVTGGTPPLTYLWVRAIDTAWVGFTEDISNVYAGWYAVGILDSVGCDDTNYVFVDEPFPIILTFSATPDSCSPACEGTANASIINGVPPLAYLWSNGATGLTVSGLCGGYSTLTVTDSAGCIKKDSINIYTLNLPSPDVVSLLSYCANDVIDTLKVIPKSGGMILWYNALPLTVPVDSGIIFFPALSIGTNRYYVTERDSQCESPPSSVEINLYALPSAEAGADAIICFGERIQLNGSGGIIYLWKPSAGLSDTITFNPFAKPEDTTEYFVTVTDINGCTARDSVTVFIDRSDNCWHVYNMFSPNNDGKNDAWIIDGIARFPENQVTLFNRFEDKVMELTGYDNVNIIWKGENNSGEPLPGGTYFYVIDIGEKTFSGWVQIIR